MVPTYVLLAAVLSSYVLVAGAFYVIAAGVNGRITDLKDSVNLRFDAVDGRLDRVDSRLDRLDDNVTGLRASVAGFVARISTLEKRV